MKQRGFILLLVLQLFFLLSLMSLELTESAVFMKKLANLNQHQR